MDKHRTLLMVVAGSVILFLVVLVYSNVNWRTENASDNANPLSSTATPSEYYTTLDGIPFATESIMTVFETPILPVATLPITSELQAESYIQDYFSEYLPELEWSQFVTRRINETTLTLLDTSNTPTAVVTVDPSHEESDMWNRRYWISAFETSAPLKMSVFQGAIGPDLDALGREEAYVRSAYVLFYDDGQIAGSGIIESEDIAGEVFTYEMWTLADLSVLTSLPYP